MLPATKTKASDFSEAFVVYYGFNYLSIHFVSHERIRARAAQVDKHLNIIRNKGRQAFMENPSDNFSRILHDYSDEKKGFIVWKDLLEERLT